MAFFPGIKGDKGDPGAASTVPGPPGAIGPEGPIGVYTHAYDPSATYFDTDVRKDIVFYNGQFWVVANPDKSGLATWGVPTGVDWDPFGLPLPVVATKIVLLYPADINQALTMFSPGYFRSNNFVQYVSGFLLTGAGRVEINDGVFIGQISTNTPRFNPESPNRTMAAVGYNELVIPPQVDGDIPVNPSLLNVPSNDTDMVFWGWTQGPNNYQDNRFGNTEQKFLINLQGVGQNGAAGTDLFYIQLYYRLRDNGGSWDPWQKIGEDVYMQPGYGIDQSFLNTQTLRVTLTGTQDIQFSAGFSKGAGGVAQVNGARISVEAFN